MYRRLLSIFVLLLAGPISAREVTVYLTVVSEGDRKDAQLGRWNDDKHYDANQDQPFTLLKRLKPIVISDHSQRSTWQIALDVSQPRQRIIGLGAALTDSAAYVLHQLKQRNPRLYEFTMRRLFSPDHGAGFSYLRRPIGSSDYTATDKNYTCADHPSDDLSTFSIEHDKQYIIPILKDVLAVKNRALRSTISDPRVHSCGWQPVPLSHEYR
jgi:glucosylceramidase